MLQVDDTVQGGVEQILLALVLWVDMAQLRPGGVLPIESDPGPVVSRSTSDWPP